MIRKLFAKLAAFRNWEVQTPSRLEQNAERARREAIENQKLANERFRMQQETKWFKRAREQQIEELTGKSNQNKREVSEPEKENEAA